MPLKNLTAVTVYVDNRSVAGSYAKVRCCKRDRAGALTPAYGCAGTYKNGATGTGVKTITLTGTELDLCKDVAGTGFPYLDLTTAGGAMPESVTSRARSPMACSLARVSCPSQAWSSAWAWALAHVFPWVTTPRCARPCRRPASSAAGSSDDIRRRRIDGPDCPTVDGGHIGCPRRLQRAQNTGPRS